MEAVAKQNVISFPFREATAAKVQCKFCHAWIDDDALFCCRCGNKQDSAGKKQRYTPKTKHTKAPLKTQEEIAKVQAILGTPRDQSDMAKRIAYRNYLIFTLGISIGLRASDLLRLKVGDFKKPTPYIIEQKTGKGRELNVNQKIKDMVFAYADKLGLKDDDYLFWSRQGGTHLSPDTLNRDILRPVARQLGWDDSKFGSHTLRKTYAYQFYKTANEISKERGYRALSVLCKELNHSSEAITLRYIGIDQEEISEICGLTVGQYNMDYNDICDCMK